MEDEPLSENLYEAPTSNLSVSETLPDNNPFYVVSSRKFLVLYVATLGSYIVYWIYRNWREYKLASNEKVMPILRAIFSIFFIHELFRKVQEKLDKNSINYSWKHRNLATYIVVLLLISNVLDRMSTKSAGSPFTDYASLIILAPLAYLFLNAQRAINIACGDENGSGNDKITAANIFWIVFGAALWGFTIYGLIITS
jgi:hypothetical protein